MKHVSGTVTLTRAQQEGPLQSGDLVEAGDTLRTGDGRCSLTLIDGARLALGPHSLLTLTRFTWDPTPRTGSSLTHLTHGTVLLSTGDMAAADPQAMMVTTPRSRLQVHGTTIAVEVRP